MFQWSTLAPFKVPQPCHKMAPRMMESRGPDPKNSEFWWWVVGWPTEFRCLWRWQAVPQTEIVWRVWRAIYFGRLSFFLVTVPEEFQPMRWLGIFFGAFFSSLSFVFWNLSKLVDCWVCTSFQLTGEEYPPQKRLTTNHHGFRPRKITRRMREKQLGRGVLHRIWEMASGWVHSWGLRMAGV